MIPGTRVLLLHGIWNARSWLVPLALRLRASGLTTEIVGYSSVFSSPDVAVANLVDRLRDGPPVSIVGHSLGGLVALEALRQVPSLPVPRLVCLGSPLCGSDAARALVTRRWPAPWLGRSAALLQRGCDRWTGPTEIGMVAGTVPRGLGRLFAHFEGDSDGTVAVAETRLEGLTDHCLVPSSHSGLVFSAAAAAQTAHFLRHGCFAAP